MNDLLKNPIALFVAGILALWLAFKLLKVFLSLFWIFVIVFIVLFISNDRFRSAVQAIFAGLFKR
jgi:predicted metal-binding membrane protein